MGAVVCILGRPSCSPAGLAVGLSIAFKASSKGPGGAASASGGASRQREARPQAGGRIIGEGGKVLTPEAICPLRSLFSMLRGEIIVGA